MCAQDQQGSILRVQKQPEADKSVYYVAVSLFMCVERSEGAWVGVFGACHRGSQYSEYIGAPSCTSARWRHQMQKQTLQCQPACFKMWGEHVEIT